MALSKRLAAMILVLVASGGQAVAFDEEDDSEMSAYSPATIAPDKARHRLYPGGRDEQDLKVQASLQTPTRSPEAPPSEGGGR